MSPRLLSWSGGKDAAWTLHAMRKRGDEVVALLTTITDEYDRVSMQGIRPSCTRRPTPPGLR